MKQIVVISGKGGTGKTVITGSFAALAADKVMADCDVDAADLHLLLAPTVEERHDFMSGKTAVIDRKRCTRCGACVAACRFEAIDSDFRVDGVSCEGCAYCSHLCPAGAIRMVDNHSGEWYVSATRFGPLVHARLGIAEENSGKLVSLVRKEAKALAEKRGSRWVIVDGAPGIGCPVIASLSGIDCAIVVTEPTLSGLHDADRVIGVTRHFGVPVKVIINKYDLNDEMASEIEAYCAKNGIELLAKVPFDRAVVEAMVAGKTVVETLAGAARESIIAAWKKIEKGLGA